MEKKGNTNQTQPELPFKMSMQAPNSITKKRIQMSKTEIY
jgi:hypothetical protein